MKKKMRVKPYLCVALVLAALIGFFLVPTHWKLLPYLPYIDTAHLHDIASRHHDFIGMDVDQFLWLTTKKGQPYMIFDQQTERDGRTYSEWVEQYPELTLNDTTKVALYCIPVESSHDREEAYLYGYFVDSEGKISGTVDPPFLW